MSSSDVKASKALSATGQLQGFIGSGAGTATNLGPIRIQSVQAQSSAADASIKIYDDFFTLVHELWFFSY